MRITVHLILSEVEDAQYRCTTSDVCRLAS